MGVPKVLGPRKGLLRSGSAQWWWMAQNSSSHLRWFANIADMDGDTLLRPADAAGDGSESHGDLGSRSMGRHGPHRGVGRV